MPTPVKFTHKMKKNIRALLLMLVIFRMSAFTATITVTVTVTVAFTVYMTPASSPSPQVCCHSDWL